MKTNENQIVVYQPNETVRLDVRLENETVWLTQEQIANLFGTKRPTITKHLANIYKSGELEREGTCSILERMGNDGKYIANVLSEELAENPLVANSATTQSPSSLTVAKFATVQQEGGREVVR